jgi:hypothetical protein
MLSSGDVVSNTGDREPSGACITAVAPGVDYVPLSLLAIVFLTYDPGNAVSAQALLYSVERLH